MCEYSVNSVIWCCPTVFSIVCGSGDDTSSTSVSRELDIFRLFNLLAVASHGQAEKQKDRMKKKHGDRHERSLFYPRSIIFHIFFAFVTFAAPEIRLKMPLSSMMRVYFD